MDVEGHERTHGTCREESSHWRSPAHKNPGSRGGEDVNGSGERKRVVRATLARGYLAPLSGQRGRKKREVREEKRLDKKEPSN